MNMLVNQMKNDDFSITKTHLLKLIMLVKSESLQLCYTDKNMHW